MHSEDILEDTPIKFEQMEEVGKNENEMLSHQEVDNVGNDLDNRKAQIIS